MGDDDQSQPTARELLGSNLTSLMNSSRELSSAPALERATGLKGTKIGRSTIDRVKKGETTVNLDYIQVLAQVFKKKPWEMLHPKLGDTSGDRAALDLGAAVDLLAATLERFPEEVRLTIADRLQTLAKAPDSAKTKQALLHALQDDGLGGELARTGTHDA
jgi:hypothetical protein